MTPLPFDFPSAAIPFVILAGHAPGVEAPLKVLFDTGNATPYILLVGERSPGAAVARRTPAEPLVVPATAGGQPAVFAPARLPEFRLGPIVLKDVSAGVSPSIDLVAAQLPGGVDAVLGQTFALQRVMRIDYRTRQLDIDAQPGPAGRAIPMEIAPVRPLSVVEAKINGRGPFRLAIDTGAGATLLSPDAAAAAGVGQGGPTIGLGGAGGTASTGRLEKADVAVGANAWTATTVVVSDIVGPVAREAGTRVDGVLGANLLARGQLILDYPGRRVWIEQGS